MRQSVQKVMASDPEEYHPASSRLLFTQCWDCERGQHDFLCVVSTRTRLHIEIHNHEMKQSKKSFGKAICFRAAWEQAWFSGKDILNCFVAKEKRHIIHFLGRSDPTGEPLLFAVAVQGRVSFEKDCAHH